MDDSQAFEILGLDGNESAEEVKRRYRDKVSVNHPDSGGTETDMEKLNIAKEVALDTIPAQLQPASAIHDSLTPPTNQQEQRRREAEKTVETLKRRGTSRYRRMRQISIATGGFFFLFLSLSRLFGEPYFLLFPDFPSIILVTALPFGVMTYIFHIKTKNVRMMVEEADEALSDKMGFIRLLQEMGIDYREKPRFTARELENAILDWGRNPPHGPLFLTNEVLSMFDILNPRLDFRSLARNVGAADLSRLIIRKGLETELLAEIESMEDEDWLIQYTFNTPAPSGVEDQTD